MTALFVAIALTLGVSGFCSLLEAFVLSTTDAEIEGLKRDFPRRGELLGKFRRDIELTSAAILTLNTIANTVGAMIIGFIAARDFPKWMVFISAGMVFGILVGAEIIPKNMWVIYRRGLLRYLVYPLQVVRWSMYPFSYLAMHSIRVIVGSRNEHDEKDQEEEIMLLAEKHAKEGALTTSERDMIQNALTLDDVPVSEIMTPRTVVSAVESHRTVEHVFSEHKNIAFARLPVFEENIDHIVGLVRRRELLQARAEDEDDKTVSELMGDAIFVPEAATAADALQQFLKWHQQLAVVVDEFGSTVGVVAMEDIVEHILGKEIYEDSDVAVDMRELARHQAGKGSDPAIENVTSGVTVGLHRRDQTQAKQKAAG